MTKKTLQIRNSTAEFLIFTYKNGENSLQVRFENKNIWLTQKMMSELFSVSIPTINEHIKNIFLSGELDENQVIRNFLITANDGKNYNTKHFNLEVIIAVGFKVNSGGAVEFRKWANGILKEFSIKGFVLDKKRLENGNYLGEDYFEELLAEIAKNFAESQFEKYRIIQDKNYISDFDRFAENILQ